jgi:putative toxin-antitoxin system antitoxin component (TIGR02293 family)
VAGLPAELPPTGARYRSTWASSAVEYRPDWGYIAHMWNTDAIGELRQAAKVLRLPLSKEARTSDAEFLALIRRGIPVNALERLSDALAPEDRSFKYRVVPKAGLARHAGAGERLTAARSIRVMRLASAWALALRIWKSEPAARAFLFRDHPILHSHRPVDLILKSEAGAQLVRGVLGRFEAGTAV